MMGAAQALRNQRRRGEGGRGGVRGPKAKAKKQEGRHRGW